MIRLEGWGGVGGRGGTRNQYRDPKERWRGEAYRGEDRRERLVLTLAKEERQQTCGRRKTLCSHCDVCLSQSEQCRQPAYLCVCPQKHHPEGLLRFLPATPRAEPHQHSTTVTCGQRGAALLLRRSLSFALARTTYKVLYKLVFGVQDLSSLDPSLSLAPFLFLALCRGGSCGARVSTHRGSDLGVEV